MMRTKPTPGGPEHWRAACLLAFLPFPLQEESRGPAAPRLDPFVEAVFALDAVPGMAVAVVQGGETVYLVGLGAADREAGRPVTPDTVFYLASTTKSFVGTAAAKLHAGGALDLDRPLAAYLTGASYHPGVDPADVRLRDLLTHTHGIENDGPVTFRLAFSGDHDPRLVRALLAHHRPAESGREFEYGNIGFNVAALAMDEALGKGWKDVLAAELFEPLGMQSTTGYVSRVDPERLAWPYRLEAQGFSRVPYAKGDSNMHSAGGLVSTARDLARWIEAHLERGVLDGRRVLAAEVVELAQRPHAVQSTREQAFTYTGYGLGWATGEYDGDALVAHHGGFNGFQTHLSLLPERGIGVAVLTNATPAGGLVGELVARCAYDLLLDRPRAAERLDDAILAFETRLAGIRASIAEDRERRAARPQTLPRPLEVYAGTYTNDVMGSITFEVVDGRLEARMGRLWSAVEVFDAERDLLRVELTGSGQVVRFEFPPDGERATAAHSEDVAFRREGGG